MRKIKVFIPIGIAALLLSLTLGAISLAGSPDVPPTPGDVSFESVIIRVLDSTTYTGTLPPEVVAGEPITLEQAWCYANLIPYPTTEDFTISVNSWGYTAHYWININVGPRPVSPYVEDGAVIWVADQVLRGGSYNLQWADFFTAEVQPWWEASINWGCQLDPPYHWAIFCGQDFESVWGSIHLPLVMRSDASTTPHQLQPTPTLRLTPTPPQ